MFGPKGPFCQSCRDALSKDPDRGGTEASRCQSAEYCQPLATGRVNSPEPDITASQMVAKVEGKLREMHFPGFLARRFARDIPSLRRWQSGVTAGT